MQPPLPTVVVASSPITAHAVNATPVVRALRGAGARVVWYLPAELSGHAARLGADVAVMDDALARAGDVPDGGGGAVASLVGVRRLYRDALTAPLEQHRLRLEGLVDEVGASLLVSDTLMLAAGVVAERRGLAWATVGDGPLQWPDPQVPPFGTGLPVLGGRAGRHRNRTVKRAVDGVLFRPALQQLNRVRCDLGLWPVADLLTAGVSRQLHLQGCTPSFEHPRPAWPPFVEFVGALGPGPGFAPPVPDRLRRGARPRRLALVSQGTRRRDPAELADPAVEALLREGFEVLVCGVHPSGGLRDGVTVMHRVDYLDALREADVFVTNGGYTGVTLALAAGTPTIQCGATEEKADIGARLRGCGAGVSIPLVRPPEWVLRRAVRHVTTSPAQRDARARLAAEFAAHDTDALLRRHLLQLVGGGWHG